MKQQRVFRTVPDIDWVEEVELSQLIEEYLMENRDRIVDAIKYSGCNVDYSRSGILYANEVNVEEVTDAIITSLSKPEEESVCPNCGDNEFKFMDKVLRCANCRRRKD